MLIIYFVFLLSNYGDSSLIDQRQAGDFNVQVDVKDIKFFAVLKGEKEEYMDYDYAYDYSEFTIKPQNRTTVKPFNGMSTSTQRMTTLNNSAPVTEIGENVTGSYAEEFTTSSENMTTNAVLKRLTQGSPIEFNVTSTTMTPTLKTPVKNCKRGFVLNQKGNCQLKLNSTGNALLKLVNLSHRLKLRRENKSNQNP